MNSEKLPYEDIITDLLILAALPFVIDRQVSFAIPQGPYLDQYNEVTTWWHHSPSCGTTTDSKTRIAYVSGDMWESA